MGGSTRQREMWDLGNCDEPVFDVDPDGRGLRLRTQLLVERPIHEVFAFFADAFQLETITPPWLHFRVVTPGPIQIAEGTRIDYRLRLHGVPIRWQSRISVWEEPFQFVDEQIRGPYRRWYHEHFFEARGDSTMVRDEVTYRVPVSWLSHAFFVRPNLDKIFRFRRSKLVEIFGSGAA